MTKKLPKGFMESDPQYATHIYINRQIVPVRQLERQVGQNVRLGFDGGEMTATAARVFGAILVKPI